MSSHTSRLRHHFNYETGDILYHYTTAEAAEAIVRTNCIWLSEFSKTNDKSEYEYAKRKYIQFYQERKIYHDDTPRYLTNMKLFSHETNVIMMIACFARERDDLALWDRYADRARGCVIGIDTHWLATRAGVAIRQVSYDEYYLGEFVNAGLQMIQDQYKKEPKNHAALTTLASLFVLDLYAFKDPRFRSESEVRISRATLVDGTHEFGLRDPGGKRADGSYVEQLPIRQRQGQYGPTRYLELLLGDGETLSAIRSIGFGPRSDESETSRVCAALANRTGIDIWRSSIPLR